MATKRSPRNGLAVAAALLLAGGGLTAYVMGEQAGRKAPEAEPPGPARRAAGPGGAGFAEEPRLLGPLVPGAGPGAPAPAQPPPGPVEPPETAGAPADPAAAKALVTSMKRLVSDLEYNANRGLKEPPQQLVAPFPEPWRPPAEAAADLPPPAIEQVTPARGPTRGGTKVTLRGRHLRDPQVMFGASPASVVRSTDREITVITPPSPPGPVTIAVTNGDGTYALAGTGFTFAD